MAVVDEAQTGVPEETLAQLARSLREAEASREPIGPLTESHPGLSVAGAYRIQQLNVHARKASSTVTRCFAPYTFPSALLRVTMS